MFGSSDVEVTAPFSLIIPLFLLAVKEFFRLTVFLVTKCPLTDGEGGLFYK